jgi:hypothetical protein
MNLEKLNLYLKNHLIMYNPTLTEWIMIIICVIIAFNGLSHL